MSTTSKLKTNESQQNLKLKIGLAFFLGLFALGLATWLGDFAANNWGYNYQKRMLVQSLVMSGIVLLGVWFLRKRFDRRFPNSIGLGSASNALKNFLFGMSIIVLPMAITLGFTELFGWANIKINTNASVLQAILPGIAFVLLFEALPEELLFRGYIYSNLNTRYRRWKSALLTVGLFVLLSMLIVPFQKYLFGISGDIGGSDSITGSYIIAMIFFGAFVVYLRILTNSVWAGIGFHLVFVYVNRLMGLEDTKLFQFTEFTSEVPAQITFISTLLLSFLGLILYPRFKKQSLGWQEIQDK